MVKNKDLQSFYFMMGRVEIGGTRDVSHNNINGINIFFSGLVGLKSKKCV
jgi:hypothetical protein